MLKRSWAGEVRNVSLLVAMIDKQFFVPPQGLALTPEGRRYAGSKRELTAFLA